MRESGHAEPPGAPESPGFDEASGAAESGGPIASERADASRRSAPSRAAAAALPAVSGARASAGSSGDRPAPAYGVVLGDTAPPAWVPRPMLGPLVRTKLRALSNHVRQAIHESPLRLVVAGGLIAVIWCGLYWLFHKVFEQVDRTPLEATVAIPLVFHFFFVAMLAMLTFSNAIIAHGALFGRRESIYLLTVPLAPLDFVTLKYLESLVLSSWSLVLLGLPLMLAMATLTHEAVFYVLFIAFFLAFIPIPGALGMLVAWAAARFFPRRAVRLLGVVCAVAAVGFTIWGLRTFQLGESGAQDWLRAFLSRMGFVEAALLPNHWVAAGIDHALNGEFSEAVLYLGVTTANALFLGWAAVMIVSRHLGAAHDRASAGATAAARGAALASRGPAGLVFFYLPRTLRLIAAKDLRTFLRDPVQWSQLAILLGLLVLYLTNMPTLRMDFGATEWNVMLPFLNLCAVSLILATFTCRFVFPLVSLEGRQRWLIGLLPMRRGYILLAKFVFAMTVTLVSAVGAMLLAAFMLKLDVIWAVLHVVVTFSICFGLCGFSVGIGARMPMFDQPNVARIANGLGGTTNLLGSVALVFVVLAAVGVATWRSRFLPEGAVPDPVSLCLWAGATVTGIAAGATALAVGARHFNRVEM